jgi:hypothetical protein
MPKGAASTPPFYKAVNWTLEDATIWEFFQFLPNLQQLPNLGFFLFTSKAIFSILTLPQCCGDKLRNKNEP